MVGVEGFEPSISWSQTRRIKPDFPTLSLFGGSGRIRTHVPFRIHCFQDRCLKPCSATLPYYCTVGYPLKPVPGIRTVYLDLICRTFRFTPVRLQCLVPRAGVEPAIKFLLLRETTLPICPPGHYWGNIWGTIPYYDFHRVGCEPLH